MDPSQQSYVTFSPDLTRSRLTVFFRPWLAIPHLVWLYLYGIAAGVLYIGHWVVAIFTGKTPQVTYDFLVGYFAYALRVQAYLFLLSNTYPPFNATDPYEVDLHTPSPRIEQQGRASSFFRYFLAIPAFVVAYVYLIGLYVTTFLAWFAIIFTGRMPAGFQRFGERATSYLEQLSTYTYLVTKTYPKMLTADDQLRIAAAGAQQLPGGTATAIPMTASQQSPTTPPSSGPFV
jgi:hypothetical protein